MVLYNARVWRQLREPPDRYNRDGEGAQGHQSLVPRFFFSRPANRPVSITKMRGLPTARSTTLCDVGNGGLRKRRCGPESAPVDQRGLPAHCESPFRRWRAWDPGMLGKQPAQHPNFPCGQREPAASDLCLSITASSIRFATLFAAN